MLTNDVATGRTCMNTLGYFLRTGGKYVDWMVKVSNCDHGVSWYKYVSNVNVIVETGVA